MTLDDIVANIRPSDTQAKRAAARRQTTAHQAAGQPGSAGRRCLSNWPESSEPQRPTVAQKTSAYRCRRRSRGGGAGRDWVSPGGHGSDGAELPGGRCRDQRDGADSRCGLDHRGCGGGHAAARESRPSRCGARAGHARHHAGTGYDPHAGRDLHSGQAWTSRCPPPSRGAQIIATGDMGIGNTTAASAVTAALTRTSPRVNHRAEGQVEVTRSLSTRSSASSGPWM